MKHNSSKRQWWTFGALLATSCAFANDGLDVVTVIADKRPVDLQDAPLSITSVAADTLAEANINDPTGLNNYVPGLQVNKSGGSERLMSIRGVGSQTPENFFTQPGVSFHLDGVFITNSIALNMGFLDVDHIEVLRGPQGTVFGQSSTGGTINVIGKRPATDHFSGELEGGFGTDDLRRIRGALNVPLGETLAVRGAIQSYRHDGYAEATGVPGGYELDDEKNMNSRVSALWSPSENLSVMLSSQIYDADHNGSALKALNDPDPDPRRVTQDFATDFVMDMDIHSLIANYKLPWATFQSTTSYQRLQHHQSSDSDRSDFANFGGYDHVATWETWAYTFMQEFTLSSQPGSRLDWIAGAFYLKSSSGQFVVEYRGQNPGDPLPILPRDLRPEQMPVNIGYENLSDVHRESWAPFFQTVFHATDRLRLTVGGRYNKDQFDGWGSDYYGPQIPRGLSSSTFTGKFSTDFDLTPNNMVYASLSRGYKPGGVNTTAAASMTIQPAIRSESVRAIEIGSKNRLLDNHLSLNAAAFYYKYNDLQFIQEDPIPFIGGIANVPRTHIWGAEAEGAARLFGNRLQLGLNLTALSGKFPDHYEALDKQLALSAEDAAEAAGAFPFSPEWIAARGAATRDIKGNKPPNLPSLAGGANASWLQRIGGLGQLTTRLEYLYRGPYKARIFNTSVIDDVPSYGQWNLFFQYQHDMAPWKAALALTNLADKDGVAARFVDPFGSGIVSNEYIPPRQALFTVGYTF